MSKLLPVDPFNESNTGIHRDASSGKLGLYDKATKLLEADGAGGLSIPSAVTVTDVKGTIEKWPFRIPAASGIDTDGLHGGLAGCDQVLDVTKTEAAATYCQVYDDSAVSKYRALEAASTGDFVQWQLLPNNTQDDDAVHFGSPLKFCQLYLDMSATVSTYTGDALAWEYWDGSAWSPLAVHDYTDATAQDGQRSFGRDGAINFLPPDDWALTTVNGVSAYWIRAVVASAADLDSALGLTNSKRHYVCKPAEGFVVGHDCTIDELTLRDEAGTPHSGADIKFVLFNFTQGTLTAELTFAQDKRNARFTDLALAAAAGDVIGVLVTQEDGTNEMGPVTLELGVTLA